MKKSISSIFFFLILSNYLLAQIAEEKLDYNNTRVTIRSGGDFFKEGYQGGFEVPKQQPNTNRTSTIFTAGLWIGGIDEDSAIHLAAMTYRQRGRDFWPGPIGSPPSDENKYNRVFKVSRADILTHKRDPSATTMLSIIEWPGNGDTTLGEPYQLAPFVDMNNNGSYEPRLGDYPKIKGIGAAYCVYNDAAEHSQSGALPLGVEVHQLFYQDTITVNGVLIDDINLATFTLINRSENTYRNFRLGIFTDYDLGNFNDETAGVEPSIIKTNYTVYPNPGSGVFHIQNLHTQNPNLLMNALGKILDVIEPHRTTFDMSERPSGVYFLKTDKCVVRFIVAGK